MRGDQQVYRLRRERTDSRLAVGLIPAAEEEGAAELLAIADCKMATSENLAYDR
jgi:hypothetical protein